MKFIRNKIFILLAIITVLLLIITIESNSRRTNRNNKFNFSFGDFVTFKDIMGMTELNDTPPRPIRVMSPDTFSIEDTSKFSQYISGGIIEQIKIPKPIFHRSLKENFENIEQEEIGSNL